MSEKSKIAWQSILAKRRAEAAAPEKAEEVQAPVTKKGSTCGNPQCCMRQMRANVTYDAPSIVGPEGYDMGPFTIRGVEPPMICAGSAWMPREKSRWEKQRDAAKSAPGLSQFKANKTK